MPEMWQHIGRKQGRNILTSLFSYPSLTWQCPLLVGVQAAGASHVHGSPGAEHRGERLRTSWGEGVAHLLYSGVYMETTPSQWSFRGQTLSTERHHRSFSFIFGHYLWPTSQGSPENNPELEKHWANQNLCENHCCLKITFKSVLFQNIILLSHLFNFSWEALSLFVIFLLTTILTQNMFPLVWQEIGEN